MSTTQNHEQVAAMLVIILRVSTTKINNISKQTIDFNFEDIFIWVMHEYFPCFKWRSCITANQMKLKHRNTYTYTLTKKYIHIRIYITVFDLIDQLFPWLKSRGGCLFFKCSFQSASHAGLLKKRHQCGIVDKLTYMIKSLIR